MTLQIRTSHQIGSGIYATVVDTGQGFGGDDPERVPSAVTTRPRDGDRLSMSRITVETHGRRLWATPNPAGPAHIYIMLPLSDLHG